jgi:D-arabinose 1-dehydrogenase-like Zn-dependent alcohol dehydrogenase
VAFWEGKSCAPLFVKKTELNFPQQLPEGFTMAQAVTLPNNFVTTFHAVTNDLGLELPWPKPEGYVPKDANARILVWGASSSVGQFALQILRYYGYINIVGTASKKHHAKLQSFGAKSVFDYRDPDVVSSILKESNGGIPLILDCIGSKYGSIEPISTIAKVTSKVAILLPVIVKDASETQAPEYEMDVYKAAEWADGVDALGVRTHQYLNVSTCPC